MVDAMAAALLPDPAWVAVLPDDAARRRALRTLLGHSARLAARDGTVLVAREAGVLGGIVWAAPGGRARRRARDLAALPRMLGLAARTGPARMRELGRLGQAVERLRPAEPVWYVEALGVLPDAQGRGLGSALLGPVLAKSDATGVPCYLETGREQNVAFYERAGFALLDAVPTGLCQDGGPTFWRMLRPAARAA